jgi:hypothetical protein
MRGIALVAFLATGWACDSGKQAAKPPALAGKTAPQAGATTTPSDATRSAANVALDPLRAGAGAAVVPAAPAPGKPAAASGAQAVRVPEGARADRNLGAAGAGTGQAIEELFPQRLEPSDGLAEARKARIVKQVRSEREAAVVALQRVIVTPDTGGAQDVYALYQYRLYAGCAEGPSRPADCPPAEEVALNPDCRAYGILHAHFDGGTGGELDLVLMPLAEAACDLQIRHWFVARLDGNAQLDAYLEVVSSQVVSREVGGKKPKVTTEHRQLLYLWSGEAPPNGADAEPSFFLELAKWTVERWHQREPPVRESIVLFRGLQSPGDYRALDLIHLLPCLDPWSDAACDPELRRRQVHSWGVGIGGD